MSQSHLSSGQPPVQTRIPLDIKKFQGWVGWTKETNSFEMSLANLKTQNNIRMIFANNTSFVSIYNVSADGSRLTTYKSDWDEQGDLSSLQELNTFYDKFPTNHLDSYLNPEGSRAFQHISVTARSPFKGQGPNYSYKINTPLFLNDIHTSNEMLDWYSGINLSFLAPHDLEKGFAKIAQNYDFKSGRKKLDMMTDNDLYNMLVMSQALICENHNLKTVYQTYKILTRPPIG